MAHYREVFKVIDDEEEETVAAVVAAILIVTITSISPKLQSHTTAFYN